MISGALRPGDTVPSVRTLARELGLSPSTVAAAYRDLRQRGVLVTHDRSRTVVGNRPPLAVRLAYPIPDALVDLATGNPDPRLLPALAPALAQIRPRAHRYGDPVAVPALADRFRAEFEADGLDAGNVAIVGGALDGIERVLQVHLRVGDRVAVEDPGYAGTLDLVRALGLHTVPVAVDERGPRPESVAAALRRGVEALVYVPRAQNPTGAAMDADRAGQLASLLGDAPDLLVIEDDHAAPVAGAPRHGPLTARGRWAAVRSVGKWLGPQLRVAGLVGDEDTVASVLGRQRLGTGWVSQLLQEVVADTWARSEADGTLERASAAYRQRREALIGALAAEDLAASGASGLNVWVPVAQEVPVVQGLAERGWAVQAGEAFRLESPPAVRLTVSGFDLADAEGLARDLGEVLDRRLGSRRG